MLVVVRRHELSDAEWAVLPRLLPGSGTAGRPRPDDRVVLNGIVWKPRTGPAWRDVPERYGSWQTLYTRFRRWALDGAFSRMLRAIQAEKDAAGDIQWLVPVDSTIVRVHQHAAGGEKGRPTGRERVITPSADPGVDRARKSTSPATGSAALSAPSCRAATPTTAPVSSR
jgi:transposase